MYAREARHAARFAGGMVMESGAAPVEDAVAMKAAAPAPMSSAAVKAEEPAPAAPDVPARKNLQETAFFLPTLESDADGRVSFTFTVPEALTGWKFIALAHDKGLRNGLLRDDTIVTP